MSEAAAKLRQPIDLEEFERRLRAPAPPPREANALDELSRLLGEANEAYRVASQPEPVAEAAPHPQEIGLRGAQPVDEFDALFKQFPDAGARLARGAPPVEHHQPDYDPRQDDEWARGQAYEADMAADAAPYAEPPRSRLRSRLYLGGALAVLVVGVGATLTMRGGPGSNGTPTIMAAPGPVKIQPEQPAAGDKASQSASVLDKGGAERLAGSKMVSREEQPIDVREAAKVARASGQSRDFAALKAGAAPSTGASSGLPTSGPASNAFFPEPRKVRTVSVRPDGSIVQPPSPPPRPAAAAAAAPPAPAPRTQIASLAANPPVVAPQPSAAQPPRPPAAIPNIPKATARVTAPTTTASIDTDAEPRARATTAPASRTPERAAATPAATTAAGGAYAVQLAAPGSEAEARTAIQRLQQRYGAALGGHKPSVRRATVGEKSVYRVRVVGLSQSDAASLCGKLKTSGAACFVARD